ncbi:hypothetical protein B0H19DRAFT_561517 [Mycena capillaripes]|nr:hypothetical protein B0H19DRAFT_561517 [Mycena capillaripes]
MAVPSIRLIVPTPDVSHADTDPNASTSVSISPGRVPSKKKSALGLLSGSVSAMQGQTPYNTTRDFSDIVRRVGGGDSVTGRGWEVRVEPEGSVRSRGGDGTWGNAETQEGEGMVLIKKKVKTRGRVDGVFADVTNNAAPARSTTPTPHAIESGRESRQEGAKDKWWNLTRGRKDTGGKDGSVGVLGFVRRGKSPGPNPSLPPTPTVEFHPPAQTRVRQPQDAQRQMYLPGEPDCTLDMVEVPSVRGRAIMKGRYLLDFFGTPLPYSSSVPLTDIHCTL